MRAGQKEIQMTNQQRFRMRVLEQFREPVGSPIAWEKKYQEGVRFLEGPPRLGGIA
ncbi:MAG: hypothetical protein Q8P67_07860 [archaeon]|nr:hypothetical protein [archaeon]